MTHPSEINLALFAGGDLNPLSRWKTEHHLANCERCRREVAELSAARSEITELGDLPMVHWSRMSAEMKANIRLGLAAGECVAPPGEPKFFPERRALLAYASIMVLMMAVLWLQRPRPLLAPPPSEGILLQATGNGIELQERGQVLSLMHSRAVEDKQDVIKSVGAQGSMRARYVDSGYVTINDVYVQ